MPSRIKRGALYALLIAFALMYLLPFWTALTTSLKTKEEIIYTIPIEFPRFPTLEPAKEAFEIMRRPLANSLIFTAVATLLSTLFGSVSGYLLSKVRFKGSEPLFLFLTIGIFIPYQIVLIPLVTTISRLGLYNTLMGLIITHTVYGIPISTLFFRSFYDEIPESLVMAAKTDGAGPWTIYARIMLPLSMPAFVVTGVFQFTSIWNDFLFGLVLTRGIEAIPASVALANLKGTTTAFWNVQMAGAWLYAIPVVAVYLVLGKHLMKGYMTGAVKG